MRISTPVTSKARKQIVVIQCVTRTSAECRGVAELAGMAAEIGANTESATWECYQIECPIPYRGVLMADSFCPLTPSFLSGHVVCGVLKIGPCDRHCGPCYEARAFLR
jgi:hypothetical protein